MTDLSTQRLGTRPRILAHLGINHDGSLTRALALIEEAAQSGATGIVLPLYHAAEEISTGFSLTSTLLPALGASAEDLRFCELGATAVEHCLSRARAMNLQVGLQVCDVIALSLAREMQVDFYCLDLAVGGAAELLPDLLASKSPLFLQLADAETMELLNLLGQIQQYCPDDRTQQQVVLMHGAQPAPCTAESASPERLELVRRYFTQCGFCDHTTDPGAAQRATLAGAAWIISYLTLDRNARGPCHHWSRDKQQLTQLVSELSACGRSLATGKQAESRRLSSDPGNESYGN